MAGTAGQNPQMAMMLWLMPIMILIFALTSQLHYHFTGLLVISLVLLKCTLSKGQRLRLAKLEAQASEYNYC